jgi:hypothetical protein
MTDQHERTILVVVWTRRPTRMSTNKYEQSRTDIENSGLFLSVHQRAMLIRVRLCPSSADLA